MASVSKRLATDETLMLLVNAVNNTETVKQAKAEIQAEGTAQVNNVMSTAEEMVKDINQVPKNTADIAELNSNLDALEYSEVAGGKNLLDLPNPYSITGTYVKDIVVKVKKNTNYTLSVGSVTSSVFQGIIVRPINSDTNIIEKYDTPYIMPFNSGDNESIRILFYSGNATSGTSVYSDVQLEYGTEATEYEPYIPSVKMLAEENEQQNDSLTSLGKCKNLLNPTLQTTTQNGVTCTNNGDGTYTLNGTATNLFQVIVGEVEIKGNQQYKTVGCPNNIINKEYCMIPYNVTSGTEFGEYDYGDGTINASKKDITYRLYIFVESGTTLSNLVFKPMLTTNLNATYDDYEPYTGDGETLTHDVANLKNDLGGLSFSVSGTTLSITDGTNTWTLSN